MKKDYHEVIAADLESLEGSAFKKLLFNLLKKYKLKTLFRFFGLPKLCLEKGKILDIGCGSGYTLLKLKEIYPEVEVFGVDIIKRKDLPPQIKFALVDIEKDGLPFKENSFDFVICRNVIEHIYRPVFLFYEAYRVLKKGGVFHVVTPNWTSIFIPSSQITRYTTNFYDDYTHIRPYTKKSLYRLFAVSGFRNISVRVERNFFIILLFPLFFIAQFTRRFDVGNLLFEVFGIDLVGEAKK